MARPAETPVTARRARQKRWTATTWVIFLSIMLPVVAGAFWLVFAAERPQDEDPAVAALARSNAGGEVQVFTGARHIVYQSVAPLPSAAAPRTDGKPTLIWFTTSNCGDCGRMDSFAHQTAARFLSRMVFVEKAVDRDLSASRYGVSSTPAFVLVDARGEEIARFGFQQTGEALRTMIEQALEKATATAK